MKATTLRLEEEFLLQLQTLAKQLDISFSTLAKAALRKVLQEKKIEISIPEYTLLPAYEKALEEDIDGQETVFVAETPGDSERFLTSIMNNEIKL